MSGNPAYEAAVEAVARATYTQASEVAPPGHPAHGVAWDELSDERRKLWADENARPLVDLVIENLGEPNAPISVGTVRVDVRPPLEEGDHDIGPLMPVGSIYIHHYLDAHGTPIVRVDRPEPDEVAILSQLGMVEMARCDIFEYMGGRDE